MLSSIYHIISFFANVYFRFKLILIHLIFTENEEKFRNLISFICRKWSPLLEEVKRIFSKRNLSEDEEEEFTKKLRRRKLSSSSDSSADETVLRDDDRIDPKDVSNEKGVVEVVPAAMALLSVLEFLDLVGGHLASKKMPVSLKFVGF